MRLFRRFKRRYLGKILIFVVPILLGVIVFYSFKIFTGSAILDIDEGFKDSVREGAVSFGEDPLDLEGFTEVRVEAYPGGILLIDNCTGVFILMSNMKSYSIKRGLEEDLDLRPNYHDLMYDVIDHYGGEVVMAKVSKLKNDFYYADLIIQKEDNILNLDSRPSDAIAIASRFKAPIYVSDGIIEKRGVEIC